MSIAMLPRSGSLVLRAPCAGVIHLHPPQALCGELEIFDAGELIASIDRESIGAPARGFILRAFVEDGATVSADTPIVELRLA